MEEEISLQDIALRLWARRGIIASLVLAAVLAMGAWAVFELDSGSRDVVYYVHLKGIEKSQYPSGAAFSPNDLQSPEVLRAAIVGAGLDSDSLDAVTSGLLIEYGSPETFGLIKKYRERLSGKNLSAAEIDARNAEFKDELELATGSSLSIMLNPAMAGVSTAAAVRLAQEIPAQWTRIYSERYRIYSAPGLDSVDVDHDAISLREPATTIAANRVLQTVAKGLKTVENDNRISHLVNSSGRTASELLERVRSFQSTQFGPVSLDVLGRPHPVTDSYRLDLRFRIQYLTDQIEGYNRIAQDVFRGREGAAAEWADSSDNSAVNQLQLSGDSLGTIIDLTERASSAEFLREVMLDRHELARERAEVTVELARLKATAQRELSDAFVGTVEREFASLTAEYQDLYSVALEKLRADLGILYSANAAPMQMSGVDLERAAFRMIGAALAALAIGCLAALMMPDVNGTKQRPAATRPPG